MKKNLVIAVLAILAILEFISINQMSNRASYHMKNEYAAYELIHAYDVVMDSVIDTDYFIDVISETDAWNDVMIITDKYPNLSED